MEVNCATLRGDGAMAALFGHTRGAFTGAANAREGLLRAANGGVLFLDEIGELGVDEQAMLLRALETGRFLPMGADTERESAFQLIAGTNTDLKKATENGALRDDLLARIDRWSFRLPALRERSEDIEPHIKYELERFARERGTNVRFNKEAREHYLTFALAPGATWSRNFRDLSANVTRMATLATGGRISTEVVTEEIERLRVTWRASQQDTDVDLKALLDGREIDQFDAVQLAEVVRICRQHRTLSAAGRTLFAVSRTNKDNPNDADRLRKYLARFSLRWQDLQG